MAWGNTTVSKTGPLVQGYSTNEYLCEWLKPQKQPKSFSKRRNKIFLSGQVSYFMSTQQLPYRTCFSKLKAERPANKLQLKVADLSEHIKTGSTEQIQ